MQAQDVRVVIFVFYKKFFILLITVRKRSLGQGNIFIGVCQEFCSRGGGVPGQVHPPGPGTPPQCFFFFAFFPLLFSKFLINYFIICSPPRAVHAGRYGQQAGSTHPTGMHSCLCLILISTDYSQQQCIPVQECIPVGCLPAAH